MWTKKLSVFVVDETTGCHLWQGRTNANGYGQVTTRGRAHMVHRLVWESVHGKLPPGLEIDHVAARGCRHRNCFNIEHLEPVTRQENVRRMWQQRKGA